jgi:hypothetical protein
MHVLRHIVHFRMPGCQKKKIAYKIIRLYFRHNTNRAVQFRKGRITCGGFFKAKLMVKIVPVPMPPTPSARSNSVLQSYLTFLQVFLLSV